MEDNKIGIWSIPDDKDYVTLPSEEYKRLKSLESRIVLLENVLALDEVTRKNFSDEEFLKKDTDSRLRNGLSRKAEEFISVSTEVGVYGDLFFRGKIMVVKPLEEPE